VATTVPTVSLNVYLTALSETQDYIVSNNSNCKNWKGYKRKEKKAFFKVLLALFSSCHMGNARRKTQASNTKW